MVRKVFSEAKKQKMHESELREALSPPPEPTPETREESAANDAPSVPLKPTSTATATLLVAMLALGP